MTHYMLIVRNEDFDPSKYTPEKMDSIFNTVESWINKLNSEKILVDTAPLLTPKGKTIRNKSNHLVVDGPYTEGKEMISGYYIIRADTQDAAVGIARDVPQLTYGCSVEVVEMGRLRHGCVDQ